MDFAALIYHRQAFLDGQWWLPLTAQVVHFNAAHGLANGAMAALMVTLFQHRLRWQHQGVLVLISALAVAMVVTLDEGCTYYAGASGALYGWAAGGCLWSLFTGRNRGGVYRQMVWVLLVFLAARLIAMQWAGLHTSAWGFPVYLPAHWAGLVAGATAGSLLALRQAPPQSGQDAEQAQ